MGRVFRVIDSGIREGREQIAFDQAMVELHKDGRIPDTVRFLRFPPTALLGRHQALGQELKLDFCRANGIGLVRRITGGGALYMDEGQLGWELVFHRRSLPKADLAVYAKAICDAVAAGLRKSFDIDARFRPRNDIEVGGRKLCGTGGFFDGQSLFYQGTVLIEMNAERMASCLNLPEAKLKKRALDSPAQRVVTLKELLGAAPPVSDVQEAVLSGFADELGIEVERGQITTDEWSRTRRIYDEEIGTEEFVFEIDNPGGGNMFSASHEGVGGGVSVHLRVEGPGKGRIREALITGSFLVTPPRVVYDLEASLRGVAVPDAGAMVEQFFLRHDVGMLSMSSSDFRRVVEAALAECSDCL